MARSIDEIIKESEQAIIAKNYDEANSLLQGAIRILDTTDICPKDSDTIEYHSFFEPIQEVLYFHLMKPTKEIIRTQEDYSGLYRIYGRLLIELKQYEAARVNLVKALRWNPLNLTAKFEYAQTYRFAGDWDMYAAINAECLKYGYYTKAIARAYANLAYYYMYKGEYPLSVALVYTGREFDRDSIDVATAMSFIESATNKKTKQPSSKKVKKLFKKNAIQWGASDEVISTIYSYGQHYIKTMDYKSARYFLRYAYSLSADKAILRLLKILPTY